MPKPITHHQRRALLKFLAERLALFAVLEHDRLTPLPAATAHRGRAAIAGGLRLIAGAGHKLAAPLSDSGPLMPVDLFVTLCKVSLSLESEFRQRLQPLDKIYPRRSAAA